MGEIDVPFKSLNGHDRNMVFKNAKVSMPSVGARRWNKDTKHRAVLDEDWGLLHHKPTGQEDPLLCSNGTYFMNMYVRKRLLGNNLSPDVGRLGTA